MSEKKPSREQICRDNLDQGMKVIFDYIKENVDSANNSPSTIMSLFDDILKVIYQGVLTTVWIRLSKLLLFWTTSFNSSFSLFQLLRLFNFCHQCRPYMVSILKIFFSKNYAYKKGNSETIFFPIKSVLLRKQSVQPFKSFSIWKSLFQFKTCIRQ